MFNICFKGPQVGGAARHRHASLWQTAILTDWLRPWRGHRQVAPSSEHIHSLHPPPCNDECFEVGGGEVCVNVCIRVSRTGTHRSNGALNPVKTFHLIHFACLPVFFLFLLLDFSQTVNAARRHHGDTETLGQCGCWQPGSLLRESVGKYKFK